jgi:hypothetical protein
MSQLALLPRMSETIDKLPALLSNWHPNAFAYLSADRGHDDSSAIGGRPSASGLASAGF